MEKFDSILFGNGLTIATLRNISQFSENYISRYFDCDTFISDFIFAEPHKRILKDFNTFFSINDETKIYHENVRKIIEENVSEIQLLGFERWVSKNLFDKDKNLTHAKPYLYFLYNFWFSLIYQEIIGNRKIKFYIEKISNDINNLIYDSNFIFTLNFDKIYDNYLNVKHIHGVFQYPLKNFNDLILYHFNENSFEYKYLFGSNGLEKLSRIDKIYKLEQSSYDLQFMYNDSLNLGNLLIYGISFGHAEFLSKEFLDKHPQHNKNKLVMSVDGHIIQKLLIRFQNKQLEKITISYYSEDDLNNYKLVFQETEIENIINYIHCSDLIDFNSFK